MTWIVVPDRCGSWGEGFLREISPCVLKRQSWKRLHASRFWPVGRLCAGFDRLAVRSAESADTDGRPLALAGVTKPQGRALIFTSVSFRPVPDFLRSDGIVPRPARVVTPVEVLLPAWSTQLIENRSIAKTARSCGATRLECRRARR